jgi:hypothetical protein
MFGDELRDLLQAVVDRLGQRFQRAVLAGEGLAGEPRMMDQRSPLRGQLPRRV